MRRWFSLVALLPFLLAAGCGPVGSTKESAKEVPPGAFPLTPENTKIDFVGSKPDGKHTGGFKQFSGAAEMKGDDLGTARFHVEITTDSLYTDTDKLTTHLKSPDFFEVKTYPKATFVSTEVKPAEGADATHQVTGDLTLHGVTKSISFPAKLKLDGEVLNLTSDFTIQRKDFGITFDKAPIHNDVAIKVEVKAGRKK